MNSIGKNEESQLDHNCGYGKNSLQLLWNFLIESNIPNGAIFNSFWIQSPTMM